MRTLEIDIIYSKAGKIIKSLTELNLTVIRNNSSSKSLDELLSKFRSKGNALTTEEITEEVELVLSKRYEKKA
jgi:hypothetical protein